MNHPDWTLDVLAWRLRAAGARRLPETRRGMRLLRDVYVIASQHGPRRRLAGAIKKAGEHGALAAQLGEENRRIYAETCRRLGVAR